MMKVQKMTAEEARAMVADPEIEGGLSTAEWKVGDLEWWIDTLDAVRGGLAALSVLVGDVDSQNDVGLREDAGPHIDAIAGAVRKVRAVYAYNLRLIKNTVKG